MTQERTGSPSGQCVEACVASLLGLELQQVPDLWVLSGRPSDPAQRLPGQAALFGWLHGHGLMWVRGAVHRQRLPLDLTPLDAPGAALVVAPHILVGENQGGVRHAVVGHFGRVLWDPNPSRQGLAWVDGVVALRPLSSIPPHLHGELALEISMYPRGAEAPRSTQVSPGGLVLPQGSRRHTHAPDRS